MQEWEVVTCGYCEQNTRVFTESENGWEIPTFFCRPCERMRRYTDPICEQFGLRWGLHTDKWYPGKPE